MTTQVKNHTITRGNPFKPGILDLADDAGTAIPVASLSTLVLTIRKKIPVAQVSDADADVVAKVSLTPNAQGVITQVDTAAVQLLVHGSVTRVWDLGEYVYDVEGVLVADGEPYTPVKGRILVTWAANRDP